MGRRHSFGVDIACEYGLLEAILLEHLAFWIFHNEANGKNFNDGTYWTFNSLAAFKRLFPYASEHKIRLALDHLKSAGLIRTGNFNEKAADRTMWYALTPHGYSFFKSVKLIPKNCQMEIANLSNPFDKNDRAIPDIKPDTNTDTNPYIDNMGDMSSELGSNKRTGKRFIPPTVEEVRAYCKSRANNIDAEAFVDYYASQNWKKSNGQKVSDWKGCVRTWEKKRFKGTLKTKYSQPDYSRDGDFIAFMEGE